MDFNPALPSFISNSNTQAAPKDEVCTGMRVLVKAIGQAYERAIAEGGNKEVLAYMQHAKRGRSKRPLVQKLVAKDGKFEPGAWYTESKYPTDSNDRPFENLVEKVEAQTDVVWASWLPSERSTDAAPIA